MYSSKHPEKTFEEFMKNRGARFYHPESDPPIYTADYYNKPVDFSIVISQPLLYGIHPKDCCTLMTYKEAKVLKQNLKNKKEILLSGYQEEGISKEKINNYYVLVVKSYTSSLEKI